MEKKEAPTSKDSTLPPELIEAMTKHFFDLQKANKSTNSSTKSQKKIHKYGKITLHELEEHLKFKSTNTLGPRQQTILDYLWNAKTRPQTMVALHALSNFMSEAPQKTLSLNITEPKLLTPEEQNPLVPQKLLNLLHELEVSNKNLQEQVIQLSGVERENQELKDYIIQEEQSALVSQNWRKFPEKLFPLKQKILEHLLANYIGEQLHYQEMFRRLACQEASITGLSFKMETYEPQEGCKGFSYITCNISLSTINEERLAEFGLSIKSLNKFGLISKLIISHARQLQYIREQEVLFNLLTTLYEDNYERIFEVEIQAIPPSYFPRHLDNTRRYINITEMVTADISYKIIPQEHMVSTESVDLYDQVNMYRSMTYRKPFCILPRRRLIAEDSDNKIFMHKYNAKSSMSLRFKNQSTEFAQETMYFNKIRAYHMTRIEGDFLPFIKQEPIDEEDAQFDDETLQNINNSMEA